MSFGARDNSYAYIFHSIATNRMNFVAILSIATDFANICRDTRDNDKLQKISRLSG